MRLGRVTNGVSCEGRMQGVMGTWLKGRGFAFLSEVRVPDVSRIADFLLVSDGRLVNIEAKCLDFGCMLKQLDDHAKYCDYCFAYIPDYAPTPRWFKERLVAKGYGLIVYNYEGKHVTEVLEAHKNLGLNMSVRNRLINKIRTSRVK